MQVVDYKPIRRQNILHKVRAGETLESIASFYAVRTDDVILTQQDIVVGDVVLISQRGQNVYVVKPLDTLESVAQKFNIPLQVLQAANQTKQLFIGQLLVIPE